MTQLLTTREAAKFLGLTLNAFRTYCTTEGPPKATIRGGRGKSNLYTEADLTTWNEERKARIPRVKMARSVRMELWVHPEDLQKWREEAERRHISLPDLIRVAMSEQLP